MVKQFLIGLCFVLHASLIGQVTLSVTNPAAGFPGSADVVLLQAETLANAGQVVTVNMNAPSLCNVNNIVLVLTNGKIILQKDPNAITPQGFAIPSFAINSYGVSFFQTNNTIDVTVQDIEFDNYNYCLSFYGGGNITCSNVRFVNYGSGIDLNDNSAVTLSPSIIANALIQNCDFEPINNLNVALPNAIMRSNTVSNPNNQNNLIILNNNFRNTNAPNGIYIDSYTQFDNLNIQINNNYSSNGIYLNRVGTSYFAPNTVVDYKFALFFENNTEVRALELTYPINSWKVDNNTFKANSANYYGSYIWLVAYPVGNKLSFINSPSYYCANQTYLNGNNIFLPYLGSFPNNAFAINVIGNGFPGCAIHEFLDLDLPGAIFIYNQTNVSVRRCRIKSHINPDQPIFNQVNFINASLCSAGIVSNSLVTNYKYINAPPSAGNDLYLDFYKTNANGDLLDYIGEKIIPNNLISNSGTASVTIPGSVTLNNSDRIAMTITGLTSPSFPNSPALGTSFAFYTLLSKCPQGFDIQSTPFPIAAGNCISNVVNCSPGCPPCFYTDPCWLTCFSSICSYSMAVCKNSSFQLNTGSSNPGTSYIWNFGDASPPVSGPTASHIYSNVGNYTLTVTTIVTGTCVALTETVSISVVDCSCVGASITGLNSGNCNGVPVNMNVAGCINPGATYNWSFGDGTSAMGLPISHAYSTPGTYNVVLTVNTPGFPPVIITGVITISACTQVAPCTDCIGTFAPDPGDYLASLWVKEDVTPQPQTYNNPQLKISFIGDPTIYTFGTNATKNKIIEGWQKIEELFTIPIAATSIKLELINASSIVDTYFDDLRVYPKDGQMKTYVYDPATLRLTSTLDENNYATFYEYDEEGKLIRIKKETEKGIMTIQESREAVKKK